MSEERENIVVLLDDEGNELHYEVLDIIEYNGSEYACGVDINADEDDEEGTVLIMKIVHANDEEDILEPVNDDNVLQSVFEIFKEHMEDEFEFDGE